MTKHKMVEPTVFYSIAAVPTVLLLTQAAKQTFRFHRTLVPLTALTFGLGYSAFIERRGDMVEGVIMGCLYGLAGIGLYALLRTLFRFYRQRGNGPFR
ncbi:hypothetical protein EWH99_12870 [Sporolactobacillus sp. THM7-7]|nr:hypothetical protein EWH99_12870 [Sporolactobacillus sp. THM7-7]